MSRTAKVTLAASATFAVVTIWGVHWLQKYESELMYQGVVKDEARVKAKKLQIQREADYQESLRKRELYERVQPVASAAGSTS